MGEYKYVAYMANMLYVLFLYSKIERRDVKYVYFIRWEELCDGKSYEIR